MCRLKSDSAGIHPPEGGWKPETYYAVDIKCFSSNPVHRTIFYSGFLSNIGEPSGYNTTLMPTGDQCEIGELFYLKVSHELNVDGTLAGKAHI